MEKICKGCDQSLPLESFHKSKRTKDGYHVRCKECKSKYDSLYREKKEYKDKERVRGAYRRAHEWGLKVQSARQNALTRKYEWNITIEDVPIPENCPLLGIPLVLDSPIRWNKPSIDRIDQSKGYIKGNVWVISVLANTMKSIATKNQLITFSKNVLHYFDT